MRVEIDGEHNSFIISRLTEAQTGGTAVRFYSSQIHRLFLQQGYQSAPRLKSELGLHSL